MRPLVVVTGVIVGSSISITISLLAVLLIFLILGDQYPRLAYEFNTLLASTGLFLLLTMISAMSFYALLKRGPSRWWWQGGMWAALIATGWYFWP